MTITALRSIVKPKAIIISSVLLALVLAALAELLSPAVEMTRFRNALLADVGEPADFHWSPGRMPPDYRDESTPAPATLTSGVASIGIESDAVTAMAGLVEHLRVRPKQRGPIQSNTLEAYRIIREEGRGYCADYTQVFNGLAHAASLPVREWGMSFDRFSGDGHAFNEVFDGKAEQWVFVDPMHGFFVRDRQSGIPLSVLEYRERLVRADGFRTIEIVPIGSTFMFDSGREAFDYYRAGVDQFYLWFGNDVFTYDNHPLVKVLGPVARPIEQLAAIIAGIHPTIRILTTPTNGPEIKALFKLRTQVIVLALLATLFCLLILFQLFFLLRQRLANTRSITA